ncbi:MAG: hypothetical protein ACR2G2_19175 [Pseudonocardia sp.]
MPTRTTERENIREATLEGLNAAANRPHLEPGQHLSSARRTHESRHAYPDAIKPAHADFAALQAGI